MKEKQTTKNMKRPGNILLFGLLLLVITLSLTACSWWDIFNFIFFRTVPSGAGTTPAPTTLGGAVTLTARTLQEHLYGELANNYDPGNAIWQEAAKYWMDVQGCVNEFGGLCEEAVSGNLQCVEFVTAAYALAGDPLPATGIGNGADFWGLYQGRAGWKTMDQSIYANTKYATMDEDDLPQPGDMVGFGGKEHIFGHIAIVVDVKKPLNGPSGMKDGSITIAQANSPGTIYRGDEAVKPGNFATFAWYANGTFETPPGFLFPDHYLQGFIRHLEGTPKINKEILAYAKMTTPQNEQQQELPDEVLQSYALTNLSDQQKKWAAIALAQAGRFKLSPQYFLKQIKQESNFNDKAVSSAGAQGIAQFMLDTAKEIPRCILDLAEKDPLNCGNQAGSEKGIDPKKPEEALPAAAYYMATHYEHYLQKCVATESCPVDTNMAMARSLAAYNAGRGATDSALDQCGTSWLLCMDQKQADHQTRDYIAIIMGCDVVTKSGAICPKT